MGNNEVALMLTKHELALLWKAIDTDIKRIIRNGKRRAKTGSNSGISAAAMEAADLQSLKNEVFALFSSMP